MKKQVKLITLDTETYNGLVGDLKRIAIYDGVKVYYGYKFEDIENILLNYELMGFDVRVYIHNMEFDLRKIPVIFKNVKWKKSLIINGKVAKIQCINYCFQDSFKLLPMSLSKLSKGFDIEHQKVDLYTAIRFRYGNKYNIFTDGKIDKNKTLVNFLDKCHVDDPLYLEYLGYDVISLYEVLEKLRDLTGLSLEEFCNRISTASLSRYLFKNGYKNIQFKNSFNNRTDYEMLCLTKWKYNPEVEDFLRMTYCGGRTEVFKIKLTEHGYHYDINSLYPFVMAEFEYPVGKPEYHEDGELARDYFKRWQKDNIGMGFINATVYIPKQHIPPLPVKMGKLTFPCGYVYGSWTYHELQYAIENCGVKIIEYHAVCHFEQSYPIFRNFISEFSKMKEKASEEKNDALRTFSKLIQNVGYGYTGMKRDKSGLDSIDNIDEYENIISIDRDMGFIEVPVEVKSEYIQVQVASYVTSFARLVLLKGLKEVEKNGGTVYYCDTDSIVSNIPLPDNIVHKSKLGFWKLESEPVKALFLRPKVYVEMCENEPETIKFKGVSRETQKTFNYTFYENIYEELKDGKADYKIIEKNKMMLRSVMYMHKKHLDMNYYEMRDKKINYKTIEKRKMNYIENYTEPYYFETLEQFEKFSFNPNKNEIQFNMI